MSPEPERGHARREVDGELPEREYVPTYEQFMRWRQTGKLDDLEREPAARLKHQPYLIEGSVEDIAAWLADASPADRSEIEPDRQIARDGRAERTGVELSGASDRSAPGRQTRDADAESGTVLAEVIGRLAGLDLGPSGFFVICHRGP